MKVHVVYDAKGEVIAMGVPLPPAYDFIGPKSGPKALDDQHVGQLEVPSELHDLSFHELAERVQVDTSKKPHRLTVKS